tara:strand:- start:14 stop:136 length:123 start_codon:yes stop_codon:yes gene_type:complete
LKIKSNFEKLENEDNYEKYKFCVIPNDNRFGAGGGLSIWF